MPKKSEFQMSSKLIKPNTHINGVEKSQDDSYSRRLENPVYPCFFSPERGLRLRKMISSKTRGREWKENTWKHTLLYSSPTQNQGHIHGFCTWWLQETLQRVFTPCPLLDDLFPTMTKVFFIEYSWWCPQMCSLWGTLRKKDSKGKGIGHSSLSL